MAALAATPSTLCVIKTTIMFTDRLSAIIEQIEEFKVATSSDYCVYRGQAENLWNLRPSLYVKKVQKEWNERQLWDKENGLYFDFTVNAKGILDSRVSSWETLFQMRHFGLPTRILDWTENLNMALYFAAYGDGKNPCIWILNPHMLNEVSLLNSDIPNPLDPCDGIKDYRNYFLTYNNADRVYNLPFAIIAPRMSDRIFAQKGLFTVQGHDEKMIDEVEELSKCVKRIDILDEKTTKEDVKDYLKIMGVNHFTVYPDFEGLRMFLMEEYDLE